MDGEQVTAEDARPGRRFLTIGVREWLYLIPLMFLALAIVIQLIQMDNSTKRQDDLSSQVGQLAQQVRDLGGVPVINVEVPPPTFSGGTVPGRTSTSSSSGGNGSHGSGGSGLSSTPSTQPEGPSTTTTTTMPTPSTPSTICVVKVCIN